MASDPQDRVGEVREALTMTIAASHPLTWRQRLAVALGVHAESPADTIADALLALRAAPSGEAEPVAWVPRTADGRMLFEHTSPTADAVQESVEVYNGFDPATVADGVVPMACIPLYTHPAPVAVTPEMVEAGARAIFDYAPPDTEQINADPFGPPRLWEKHPEYLRDIMRGQARAAIADALRAAQGAR